MRHHNHTRHSPPAARRLRPGFTLVEMLVSMALILFVMVLLTAAFSTGLQVFRQLKGLGDMEEHLRSTAQILRRDLVAKHFENGRMLSDPTFWVDGPPQQGFFRIWQGGPSTTEGTDGDGIPSVRATNHILHFTSKLTGQGQGDFATSSVPTTLPVTGGADSRYQQSGQFRGRWYEVVYFLRPNGLAANGSGLSLYTLYRRQLGILDLAGSVSPTVAASLTSLPVQTINGVDWANYCEISCRKTSDVQNLPTSFPPTTYPDSIHFNSPADLTMPARRFGMLPGLASPNEIAGIPAIPLRSTITPPLVSIGARLYPIFGDALPSPPSPWSLPAALQPPYVGNPSPWCGSTPLQGADVMLSDVISFDIQVSTLQAPWTFGDIPGGSNTVFQTAGIGVFDTWSNQNDGTFDYSNSMSTTAAPSAITVPIQANIAAIKISIRVWDAKTLQARQITIIQDM